jgi:exodeoxyribonuclease VII small subunit
MSKAPKAAGNEEASELSFGDALQKLQGVVEEMESDDLPLEALLTRYEEGMKLARVCEVRLSRAEVRIQQLEQTAAGELKLKPVAVAETESETV